MNQATDTQVLPSASSHLGGEQLLGAFTGQAFTAELTIAELGMLERPDMHWPAKGMRLNGSHLVLRCRRMCHIGRKVVVAIHLAGCESKVLMGHVVACEYLRGGEHGVAVKLIPMQRNHLITEWLASLLPAPAVSRLRVMA